MNYLFVVAHPDDEILGAGASIKKLTDEEHNVDLCIMSSQVGARNLRPGDNDLKNDICKSNGIVGIRTRYDGEFPNIEMNNSSHLKLVQFIEQSIRQSEPDIVVTHHSSDTNNDHMHTSMACQEAVRLFQRNPDIKPLIELWFMEVPSSTEWSVNTAMNRFIPNLFIEVGEKLVDKKIEALGAYRDVMRPYPHPRSVEAIKGLAAYRGAQSGCKYAEAFECAFRRMV